MNILCVEQYSHLGGGQRCLLDLLPAFLDQGWTVRVALPGSGPIEDKLSEIGIQTHSLNCRSYTSIKKPAREILRFLLELPRLAFRLARLCKEHQIDLLYVNGPRLLPGAAIAARLLRIPLIFHCHHRITQRSAVWLAATALRWAHAQVIACCAYASEPIRVHIAAPRIRIIYNGVANDLQYRPPSFGTIRRIGVIGRIEPEKGQLEFVAAARLLTTEVSGCIFSIAGAPLFSDLKYLQSVIHASRNLPVEFLGWRDDIEAVFRTLDLLVVPSTRFDATPRVILEAFAAGVPVIAFPAGGIPEIIEDNQTGFLATKSTAAALATRIRDVLEADPNHVLAVTRRARERTERGFSIGSFQSRVCAVLAETGGSPIRPGSPCSPGVTGLLQKLHNSATTMPQPPP
jgi:glycosyltransferase involved in cell wall biosynthesis